MKTIQVVSIKGINYGDTTVEAVPFFRAVTDACNEVGNFVPIGLSATCGDLSGYFTLLVGVPDNVPDRKVETLGFQLANALIGKYYILPEAIEHVGKWIMTAVNKKEIEIAQA